MHGKDPPILSRALTYRRTFQHRSPALPPPCAASRGGVIFHPSPCDRAHTPGEKPADRETCETNRDGPKPHAEAALGSSCGIHPEHLDQVGYLPEMPQRVARRLIVSP